MTATHPRRRTDLLVGELADGRETFFVDAVDATGDRVVSLNPIASAIWYLCDGKRDAAGIAGEIHAAFPNVDLATIRADTEKTLDLLATHRLLSD